MIWFIGLEKDVNICVEVFRYAVDCILSGIEQLKRNHTCDSAWLKRQCDSYGYGFAFGIRDAFAAQQRENKADWGLIMAVPKEVEDACSNFGEKDFKAKASQNLSYNAYSEGYREGKEFNTSRRLQERRGQDGQPVYSA